MTLNVVRAEDPDYSNDAENAQVIATDGSHIYGELATSADQDWFKITAPAHMRYSITLKGEYAAGYKVVDIFQADEFGTLYKTLSATVWSNDIQSRTFYIEEDYDVFIKIYYDAGDYEFYVQNLGQILPDNYSTDCSAPTYLAVEDEPQIGILAHYEDESLESDWFTFDTEPLHKYEINITRSDNAYVNIRLYNSDCEQLVGNNSTITTTSWFGEPYKIMVTGDAGYLGSYYTLDITDLGLYYDDYSNVFSGATEVPVNGTMINGEIEFSSNYHSDEDWFKFTPSVNHLYRITHKGEYSKGYKVVKIYQIDEFDTMHETLNITCWSDDIQSKTFFIEDPEDIYLKVYYDNGEYQFYLEDLGAYTPDGTEDSCVNPVDITVNASPISGTLSHNQDGSLEKDWYIFETEALHKYEIRYTKSDNTYLDMRIYNADCGQVIGNGNNHTVVSWTGEDYKIMVGGDAGYLGTYYTLEVVDLGIFSDDYPNTAAQAVEMPKDGTLIDGTVNYSANYHGDEDWFTFTAALDGTYTFTLTGEYAMGYKSIYIYSMDGYGQLHSVRNTSVWSDSINTFDVTLGAGEIYVKVYYDLGDYSLSVLSPDPRCGDLDHPYPVGDANQDCTVDLTDFALMAANWLTCSAPGCEEEIIE